MRLVWLGLDGHLFVIVLVGGYDADPAVWRNTSITGSSLPSALDGGG